MSRPPRSPSPRPPRFQLLPSHPPPPQPRRLNNASGININVGEDCEILDMDDCIKEEDTQLKKKRKRKTSDYWNHMERLPTPKGGTERCKCRGCGQDFGCATRGVDEKLSIVKTTLYKLFNEYVNNVEATPIDSHPSNLTSKANTNWSKEYDAFEEQEMKETTLKGQSELDLYLSEPKLVGHKDLDVLEYWRGLSQQYGDLGRMARDILSIPITTVASESTFSIGGRILNKYRSCILSTNLEALICTRNWILGFPEDDELDSIDVAIDGASERTTQIDEDKNHPNVVILDDKE